MIMNIKGGQVEFVAELAESAVKCGHAYVVAYVCWVLARHVFGDRATIKKRILSEKVLYQMGMGERSASSAIKMMLELRFVENKGHLLTLRDMDDVAIILIEKTGVIPRTALYIPVKDITMSWTKIKAALTTHLRRRCSRNNMSLNGIGKVVGKSKSTMRRWSKAYGDKIIPQYAAVEEYHDVIKTVERVKELNGGRRNGRYKAEYNKRRRVWEINERKPNKYSNRKVRSKDVSNREDIAKINTLATILSDKFDGPIARKLRRKYKRTYGR